MSLMNKDKRSLCLLLLLGDGCLHLTSNKASAAITIGHGIVQADYQAWKAKLLTEIFGREVRCRNSHKGKAVQLSVSDVRMRSWKKFTYPNNKKDLARILPFIRHPEMALAVWLMDDGYVEASVVKADKTECYGARLRLFTCDQTLETQAKIIDWFKTNFDVNLRICYSKKGNKQYPYLKINNSDSLKIWEKIRSFVLEFKSMQHKFRYLELMYQKKSYSATPSIEG